MLLKQRSAASTANMTCMRLALQFQDKITFIRWDLLMFTFDRMTSRAQLIVVREFNITKSEDKMT